MAPPSSVPANAAAVAGRGGVRVPDLPQPPPHGRGGRQANTILLSFLSFSPIISFSHSYFSQLSACR